jgi:bifunctional enzyme CysN/CysC
MATSPTSSPPTSSLPAPARAQEPAALHHLRLGRRRQEHADRAPAVRVEDAVRGPARRHRGRFAKWGTQGGDIDFALLVDGLAAEREQGITIDVAYRFFSTDRRKFIVADTPGHEQYTRNMVTGASTADVAVILIDARKGVLTQTRRHSYLVSLIGIRKVVLAINKMDLVDYSRPGVSPHRGGLPRLRPADRAGRHHRDPAVGAEGRQHARAQRAHALVPRPDADGLPGDGRTRRDAPAGRPVAAAGAVGEPPNLDFRGFAGTIAGGTVRPGDRVRVQPSGRESTVARIVTADGDLPLAVAGQSSR